MTARVSICVPNLNTRPFLPERFQTVFDQSYRNWELLVYDSYSTDGAWEYIREVAAGERRMRVWQGPREGTPGSWNPCIREARGDFVYIATSDDTMPADCLDKLVAALDAHPECDVAHCPLRPIDEQGRDLTDIARWWWIDSPFARSSGALMRRPHVRQAPFDGLLHLLGGSVYISITQLLVRRSLFERIGWFPATWGSVGDFNWSMRAGLIANTVHVPDTWGGWRLHGSQATAGVSLGSDDHARRIDAMIDDAIDSTQSLLTHPIRELLTSRWRHEARELRQYIRSLSHQGGSLGEKTLMARGLLTGSRPARAHLQLHARGRSLSDWVIACLEDAGLGTMLIPSPVVAADSPPGDSNESHKLSVETT